MGNLIDDLLKGIHDRKTLEHEIEITPAVRIVLDYYIKHRNDYDTTLPKIDEQSTGRAFKKALFLLPANNRLELLNIYIKSLKSHEEELIIAEDDLLYDKHKDKLMNLIIFGFFTLAFISVISVITLSVIGKELPDGDIFSAVFTNIFEIFRVIFGT